MDPVILEQQCVEARNPRRAVVEGFELRIGNKATLLRAEGKTAHGVIYSLTHAEINALYWGAGLDEYKSEAVLANINGNYIAALCCNLLEPPAHDESNPEYELKLIAAMEKLRVPVIFQAGWNSGLVRSE